MAKRRFQIAFIWLLSLPFRVLSIIFEIFNIEGLNANLEKSLQIIFCYQKLDIGNAILQSLVVAEDRRNSLHYGVDPIGILRAIKARIHSNAWQGASTIEQQFARVVSGRYEHTYFRKLKEQMLAISICKRIDKVSISKAYLAIAFYGSNIIGLDGMKKICGPNLANANFQHSIELVSRLKYPEPINETELWLQKHTRRIGYITRMLANASNTTTLSLIQSRPLIKDVTSHRSGASTHQVHPLRRAREHGNPSPTRSTNSRGLQRWRTAPTCRI